MQFLTIIQELAAGRGCPAWQTGSLCTRHQLNVIPTVPGGEHRDTHMWHLHSLAWNGDSAKQNSSVIQEHILLLLNSSKGVATAPRALRGRAATKHDFLGVRNQRGRD